MTSDSDTESDAQVSLYRRYYSDEARYYYLVCLPDEESSTWQEWVDEARNVEIEKGLHEQLHHLSNDRCPEPAGFSTH